MQLAESRKLQEERQAELVTVTATLRSATRALMASTSASELGRRSAATRFEVAISDISRQIGRIDAEIQNLDQRKTLAEQIQELTTQKAMLSEL